MEDKRSYFLKIASFYIDYYLQLHLFHKNLLSEFSL